MSISQNALVAMLVLAVLAGMALGWKMGDAFSADMVAELERDHAQALARAEANARAVQTKWQQDYQTAVRSHDENVKKLETDLSRVRADALGLRHTVDGLKHRLSASPDAACGRDGNAIADVFTACAGRYLRVAEAADRCGIDRKTLIQAWPKGSPTLPAVRQDPSPEGEGNLRSIE